MGRYPQIRFSYEDEGGGSLTREAYTTFRLPWLRNPAPPKRRFSLELPRIGHYLCKSVISSPRHEIGTVRQLALLVLG